MAKKRFIVENAIVVYERNGRRFEHTFEGPIEIVEFPDGQTVLHDLSGNPLWGYAGEERYLGTDLKNKKSKLDRPLYFPKIFHEDSRGLSRVALENSPRNYEDLSDSAILDTQDVARRAGCSPLTVLRHANAKRLKIHPKSSLSQFYYRKRDVDTWLKKESQFKRGRPKKELSNAKPQGSDQLLDEVKTNDETGIASGKRRAAGNPQRVPREDPRRPGRRGK